MAPRYARRLGTAARSVTPANGYGLGGTIEFDYFRGRTMGELAAGVDFSFDRFGTAEQGTVRVGGMEQSFASIRVISETSFVLIHTAALRLGAVRPYLSLGAGMGIGYFDSAAAAYRPGTATDTHLLGRVALGIDIDVVRFWSIALRADYTAVRGTSPLRTEDGRSLALFGDLLDLGAGIAYRF